MDTRKFRRLVGQFATGVTVITTRVGDQLHGMTANAVCSLSLEPLLLLVCVDKQAICHDQIAAAGWFAINILAADQLQVSDVFAKTEPPGPDLRGVAHHLSEEGVPLVDDCLAYLVCRLTERHDGGDHTIFIGELVTGAIVRDAPPLLFYGGDYRQLAG